MNEPEKLKRSIRSWILLFIVLLILSGITSFPLEWELKTLVGYALDRKRDVFLSEYRDYSWVSWNHSDQVAYHSLTQPESKKLSFKK